MMGDTDGNRHKNADRQNEVHEGGTVLHMWRQRAHREELPDENDKAGGMCSGDGQSTALQGHQEVKE